MENNEIKEMNGSQRLGTIHISKNGVVIAFQNKAFNNEEGECNGRSGVVIAFQNKAFNNRVRYQNNLYRL